VEAEQKDGAVVSRGSNAVHVLPHDWGRVDQFLAPLVDKLDSSVAEAQILVLTVDAETAVEVARRARGLSERATTIAATSTARATRVLRRQPPQVISGPPTEILQLMQAAVLKLESIRSVVIAWPNDMREPDRAALETIFAEVPKDARRVIVASEVDTAVEALIERYARRAPRTGGSEGEEPVSLDMRYVTAAPQVMPGALRRVLDAADPEGAAIVVPTPAAALEAREVLADLGLASDPAFTVGEEFPGQTPGLVVFYGIPAGRTNLQAAASAGARVLVVAQPRQLPSLRAMVSGTVSPMSLPEHVRWARRRDETVRDELREELLKGRLWREVLALEPLLDEFDGLEVAAAALRLLETERTRSRESEPTRKASGGSSGMARVFVNVGSRDGARAGDLVGALTNEVGIDRAAIGKIEMRESFSLIEIDPSIASEVPTKLTGVSIRGRRIIARLDQQEKAGRPGGRDGGPPDRAGRGPRGRSEGTGRGRGGDRPPMGRSSPREGGDRQSSSRPRSPRGPRRPE
jgi:ATP-dependent RNA helicase DeaD